MGVQKEVVVSRAGQLHVSLGMLSGSVFTLLHLTH